MFRTVLVLALLLVVKVLATPHFTRPGPFEEKKPVAAQEKPCAEQGGMCVVREMCSRGNIVQLAELCPLQSNHGVVCCYYQ